MRVLDPYFQELGDGGELLVQDRIGGILDTLYDMVHICSDIHPESAGALMLVVDGFEAQLLHGIRCSDDEAKLLIQSRFILLQILVSQRNNFDLTKILLVV